MAARIRTKTARCPGGRLLPRTVDAKPERIMNPMKHAPSLLLQLGFPVLAALALAPAARAADNLLANPGAEEVQGQKPARGFGLYVGAGRMKLQASSENPHGGKQAARLTLEDWHRTPQMPAQVSGYLLLGGGNGYASKETLPAASEAIGYAYDFWARGTVARAKLQIWTWDEQDNRSTTSVAPGTVALKEGWQRLRGRFALPASARHFALGIGTSVKQAEGGRLGWLEVDDASLEPVRLADGEFRAFWSSAIKATNRMEAIKAIDERLTRLKSIGINTLFYWVSSLQIATRAGLPQADDPAAGWDVLGEMLQRAHRLGMRVHAWYSPWIYKTTSRAIELRAHPDWACVNGEGKPSSEGICLARPEVRAFQLELANLLLRQYPGLDGIHIEEPGYPWGDYCYCPHCKRQFRELFALDLTPGTQEAARHNWAAFCSTDFMARLREMLSREHPRVLLSANGSPGANPDWYLGRDWTLWARRGYLDFYVPQVYTESPPDFVKRLQETQRQVQPWCPVIPGIAITWSGIYPRHNKPEALQAEIRLAREAGAPGVVFFEAGHLTDQDDSALREAFLKR